MTTGPLAGTRILEIAGIGPGPFCGMLLSDLGADVLRVDRAEAARRPKPSRPNLDVLARGRRSVAVDLKHPEGVGFVLELCERADALIEGFRPGVMERLGLGPEAVLTRNPRLVYGRMTGFGQSGPLARAAGHDINYIALAGALAPIGRKGEAPVPPLNLVGDFGGGGLFLAFGIVCALLERERSGKGQVVDAAMVDGAAALTAFIHGMRNMGAWTDTRGDNLLDGAAPYYDAYQTADGKYVSIGSIEPQFYAELVEKLGLDAKSLPDQNDRAQWPAMKQKFAALFRTKTRDEWCKRMEGSDICFAPVLEMGEVAQHPHNRERGTFVTRDGKIEPAPAPRFSRTPGAIQGAPVYAGERGDEALGDWGIPFDRVAKLRNAGALA
jgi:alpha-methylacyl-CoA racemase